MAGNCEMHETMVKRMDRLDSEKVEIVKSISQLRQEAATEAERQTVANRRIDDLETETKGFMRIATSVEILATEIKHMVAKMDEHEGRIDNIEKQPAENWRTAVVAVIAGVVGYLINLI